MNRRGRIAVCLVGVLVLVACRAGAEPPDLAGAWSVAGTDSARGDFTGRLELTATGPGTFAAAGTRVYAGRGPVTLAGTGRLAGDALTLDLTLGGPGMVERIDAAGGTAAAPAERVQGTYARTAAGTWTGNWRTLGGRPAAGPETLTRAPAGAGAVELLDVTDCEGQSVRGKAFDVRTGAESSDGARRAAVRYRVTGAPARVTLRIEYGEGDRVHARFYKGQVAAPPVLATLVDGEEKAPGEYSAPWDGRDATPAKRLLLGGTFFAVATPGPAAADGRPGEARLAFKVAAPAALAVGPKFPAGFVGDEEDDCGFEVEPAHERLPKLKDGSGFASLLDQAASAGSVFDQLQHKLSVFIYSGHGNYGRIWFYDNTRDRKNDDAHASVLTAASNGWYGSSPAVVLPRDGKPFKDVFLVITFSCLTGGVSGETDFPERMTALGADVVIAFKHEVWSGQAVPFIRGLFARLRSGQDVEVAARSAAQMADRGWTLGFETDTPELEKSVVIQKAPNLPNPLTLTPARYGDSQN